jgi:hypothetical protein
MLVTTDNVVSRISKLGDGVVGAVRIGLRDEYEHVLSLLRQLLDDVERFDGQ